MCERVGPRNLPALWISLCMLVFAFGCGSPHGTIKVSGMVTVAGEDPPGPGVVTFTVVKPAEGFPNRPAMAKFGEDGEYSATSFEPGDGLLPGEYAISIECYETPPNMEGKPVVSYISEKYMKPASSGFVLTLEPKSRPVVLDMDLDEK